MTVLSDYQPTYINRPIYETHYAIQVEQKPIKKRENLWSSTNIGITDLVSTNSVVKQSDVYGSIISELSNLKDNWDEDGAIAPPQNVIKNTISLLTTLNRIGQPINTIIPGFSGEVAINLSNGNKVSEIIFYPGISKFVTFDKGNNEANQGFYEGNTLFAILNWLNDQQ